MLKKMLFCSTLLVSPHNMIHASGYDGYKMIHRPIAEAFAIGFRNGGKYALGFSSPIVFICMLDNFPVEGIGFPGIVSAFGAMAGSALGGISSLLPMKKKVIVGEVISRMVVREKFIQRAAALGAHTGTFMGTAALIGHLIFCVQKRQERNKPSSWF